MKKMLVVASMLLLGSTAAFADADVVRYFDYENTLVTNSPSSNNYSVPDILVYSDYEDIHTITLKEAEMAAFEVQEEIEVLD